jgi:hypothetical protein
MFFVFIHGNLAVRKESTEHGDIIQENFTDNYHSNTIKMIMGYKWAVSSGYLNSLAYDFFNNILLIFAAGFFGFTVVFEGLLVTSEYNISQSSHISEIGRE